MKNCTACNREIALDVKFCPECGEKQVQKAEIIQENTTVENVQKNEQTTIPPKEKKHFPLVYSLLCLAAFVGPLNAIGVTILYVFFGTLFNNASTFYIIVTIVWSVVSIGTFVGLVMMMLKRKRGLQLYTINQIIYIIIAMVLAIALIQEPKNNGAGYAIIAFLIVPALIFLGLFWMKKFRNYLK